MGFVRRVLGGEKTPPPVHLTREQLRALPPTPGWRYAGSRVRGLNVAKREWQFSRDREIIVADPLYPLERHRMPVYRIWFPWPVMFAAAEVSNGVMIYFVPSSRPRQFQARG